MAQTGLTLRTAAASEAGPNLNWSSPTSVLAYGTPRATVGFTSNNALSDPLAVSAFNLPIPVGNTIVGIQVELAFMQNQGAAPGHIVSVILRDATGANLDTDPPLLDVAGAIAALPAFNAHVAPVAAAPASA